MTTETLSLEMSFKSFIQENSLYLKLVKTLVRESGSVTLYERLNRKLANLEVDPFFFKKQLLLFDLRRNFLSKNTRYNHYEISFLSIRMFDQILHDLKFHNASQEISDTSLALGREAMDKFVAPLLISNCLLKIQNIKSYNLNNINAKCQALKLCSKVLSDVPEVADLAELAIQRSIVGSLKFICMARVLELGLKQEGLPLSIKNTIEKGPEDLLLRNTGGKAILMLRGLSTCFEPKVIVLNKTEVQGEGFIWKHQITFIDILISCEVITVQGKFEFILSSKLLSIPDYVSNIVDYLISLNTDEQIWINKFYQNILKKKLMSIQTQLQKHPDSLPHVDKDSDNPSSFLTRVYNL